MAHLAWNSAAVTMSVVLGSSPYGAHFPSWIVTVSLLYVFTSLSDAPDAEFATPISSATPKTPAFLNRLIGTPAWFHCLFVGRGTSPARSVAAARFRSC